MCTVSNSRDSTLTIYDDTTCSRERIQRKGHIKNFLVGPKGKIWVQLENSFACLNLNLKIEYEISSQNLTDKFYQFWDFGSNSKIFILENLGCKPVTIFSNQRPKYSERSLCNFSLTTSGSRNARRNFPVSISYMTRTSASEES